MENSPAQGDASGGDARLKAVFFWNIRPWCVGDVAVCSDWWLFSLTTQGWLAHREPGFRHHTKRLPGESGSQGRTGHAKKEPRMLPSGASWPARKAPSVRANPYRARG